MSFRERFIANVPAVKPLYAGLQQAMVLDKPEHKRCELVIDPEGYVNLRYNDVAIYGQDPVAEVQAQIERFAKRPARMRVDPAFDRLAGEDLHAVVLRQTLWHSPLRHKFDPFEDGFQFNGVDIPVLLVFGIGVGIHIQFLLERFNIHRLIIADFDPQILVTSLFVADWVRITEYFQQPGRHLSVLIHPEPEYLGFLVMQSIGMTSRVLYSNALVFTHYEHDRLVQTREWLNENGQGGLQGWGYFDDELATVIQTLHNIKQNIPVYLGHEALPRPCVALVVAAGPSLDETALAAIRRWQDHAIIFSCGRALQVLHRAGIKADIHIEVERDKITHDHLTLQLKNCHIKIMDTILLLPSRMYPDLMQLSHRPLMYLKAQDSGGSLFPSLVPRLEHTNPNVANGGAALAAYFGFSDIVFFGVDLGYWNPKAHHAAGSIYFDEGGQFYRETIEATMTMRSVRGDSIPTQAVFHWSRLRLEHLIKQSPHASFYNASQGADIEGTKIVAPGEFVIGEGGPAKTDVLTALLKNFSTLSTADELIETSVANVKQSLQSLQAEMEDILAGGVTLRTEIAEKLLALDDLLRQQREMDNVAGWLLGGSLAHLGLIIWTHTSFTADDDEAVVFANRAFKIMRSFVRKATARVRQRVQEFLVKTEHPLSSWDSTPLGE